MAVDILYPYNPSSSAQITREEYEDVGASSFQLGVEKRGFKGGADFEVWDSAVAGTQLVDGIDYVLSEPDDYYGTDAGYTVYTKLQILNVAYQAGSIYITYKVVGSYVGAFNAGFRATKADGQSISASSTTIVTYPDEVYDLGGEFASPTFTAINSGKYSVSSSLAFASGAWVAANILDLRISIDGTPIAVLDRKPIEANITTVMQVKGSTIVNLTAEQTLEITIFHNRAAGALATYSSDSLFNYFGVQRLA